MVSVIDVIAVIMMMWVMSMCVPFLVVVELLPGMNNFIQVVSGCQVFGRSIPAFGGGDDEKRDEF